MKNKFLIFWLVTLRIIIGWHFLFEGLVKLYKPNWSSIGYLMDSEGIFKSFFYWLASMPELLNIIDFLNVWGLILIGLGLILGIFTRFALWSGVALLAMYYLSHPPIIGIEYGLPSEGSYMIVNKTLIELFAMVVLSYFPTGVYIGLDRFIFKRN